jgi:hypothetical protein
MFAHRKRLRVVAVRVLLAWVLSLATAFVNACVVNPVLRHPGPSTALNDHGVHAGQRGHGHEHAGHSNGSSHEHSSACDKFCDEASGGIQNPKPKADPAGGSWLAIPVVAPATTAPLAPAAVAPASDPQRWRQLVPIPIVFLRLTL